MLATPGATASASSQRHLQGLMTRRTVTAEPKNAAQYFAHIASLVQVNEDLTKLRTYNLKRRAKIAYKGYEAVLSRKKRAVSGSSIKASPGNMLYVSRPGAIPSPTTATFNPAAVLQLQAMLPRAQPVAVKPAPKIAASVSSVVPSTAVATSTATSSVASGRMTPAQMQLHQQQMKSAQLQQQPKRSDFVVGSTVLIRNTADLIACGARNLAGKSGRIVAAPQIYGQELFSVYIDEHEALFQVPFNALTLVARPTPTQQQQTQAQMQQMQAQLSVPRQNENGQASKGSKSSEQIKMEHSFQLHRLMQQQYREIQVLQQRYAECRLVNPTALSGIQKELSKLRLAHLSQVQSLKSKQALDFDWQVGSK